MQKNIFLLWLQGWDNAPWMQKQVLQSWQINNPDWKLCLLDSHNIKDYLQDIDYIYDPSKFISPQAKSDIIRLSLLKKYGGVWADSTLLCMQPLNAWVSNILKYSGLWMYHGHGAGLDSDWGPASWFILSEKNGALISKWKIKCDLFWQNNNFTKNYFWMDGLFKELLNEDKEFKLLWQKTPFLYCEEIGSAHSLSSYNCKMEEDTKILKEILKSKPPYVIKLSSNFERMFNELSSNKFKRSNAYYAIKLSKRKFIYKHEFKKPLSFPSPIKNKINLLFILKKILKDLFFYFMKSKIFRIIFNYYMKSRNV